MALEYPRQRWIATLDTPEAPDLPRYPRIAALEALAFEVDLVIIEMIGQVTVRFSQVHPSEPLRDLSIGLSDSGHPVKFVTKLSQRTLGKAGFTFYQANDSLEHFEGRPPEQCTLPVSMS
ncbi:hypothetical protein AB0B25_30085 [Nocardia sp. NPDC049190]|uniref:hypothetical protein n=1 Tax=Nocardia sp. NPDC049190 TaxID=3155650 RepID=UPI0033DE5CF2